MACANENIPVDNIVEDVSQCSVCFEKLKLPRCLPCSHTFCHACLVSYIASCCKSKETPLGFHCPLCREFIPCVGEQTEWVEQFPIDGMLKKFIEELDGEKLCESCKIDNGENKATDFCFECNEAMCESCTKYHRKLMSSRNHKVCPLTKVKRIGVRPDLYRNCRQHSDRHIEMYCHDHEEPCCALCASTLHRKCVSVNTIEMAAENIRKSGATQLLIAEMESYEHVLVDLKKAGDEDLVEIDEKSKALTHDAEKIEENIVDHIRKLKNTYLDELSKLTKESKEKVNKNTENITDRSHCVKTCKQTLSTINDKTNIAEQLLKFSRSKLMFEQMKKSETMKGRITLESENCCDVLEVKKQLVFPKLRLAVPFGVSLKGNEMKKANLTIASTFAVMGGGVLSGTYLTGESIIFPKTPLVIEIK